MRLDAVLSRFGYCSRREASLWVKAKRVAINGVPASSASQQARPVEILIDGLPVEFPDGIYAAFHKPIGCTCTKDEHEGPTIYEYLPARWLQRNPSVTTVGRLDKETSGLILISDDGQFVHKHTSPKRHIPKIYEFETGAPIPASAVALFASGTLMLSGETLPCLPAELEILSPSQGRLTLYEGRYHQVRRMLDSVSAPVIKLERIAIGSLTLDGLGLPPGEWMAIDPSQIA